MIVQGKVEMRIANFLKSPLLSQQQYISLKNNYTIQYINLILNLILPAPPPNVGIFLFFYGIKIKGRFILSSIVYMSFDCNIITVRNISFQFRLRADYVRTV